MRRVIRFDDAMYPNTEFGDFSSNRRARDAEHPGSIGLIASSVVQNFRDQSPLDIFDDRVVQGIRMRQAMALNEFVDSFHAFRRVGLFPYRRHHRLTCGTSRLS